MDLYIAVIGYRVQPPIAYGRNFTKLSDGRISCRLCNAIGPKFNHYRKVHAFTGVLDPHQTVSLGLLLYYVRTKP